MTDNSDTVKQILLLRMAYHDKSQSEHAVRGQGYRDRIRCEALENLGFIVKTLDDKHQVSISLDKKHCHTNFSRRMRNSMEAMWGKDLQDKTFDHVILDYFFSPVRQQFWCEYDIRIQLIYVRTIGWLG